MATILNQETCMVPADQLREHPRKDNRLGELGRRDDQLLAELLREIEAGTGLFGVGFTNEEFAELTGDSSGGGGNSSDGGPEPHHITCPECGHQWEE